MSVDVLDWACLVKSKTAETAKDVVRCYVNGREWVDEDDLDDDGELAIDVEEALRVADEVYDLEDL